jgi:phage terminase Nu1 subunit (DNA packaging protein)
MHANDPEMAKKWEKKEKKMKRVKELIKKMVREEMAKMNESKLNEFNKSHFLNLIKQEIESIKGQIAYAKDKVNYKGTPDWEKKEFKAVLKDKIKNLKDTEKHYKRVEKLSEGKLSEKQSAAVQRMAKQGMWVVTDGGRETIKVVKNERAAKMLVKKLKKDKSNRYHNPQADPIKLEGKLSEAKETIFDVAYRVMKDKQAYGYNTKKGLVTVDVQTANLLTKVFKKVNPKMKKILSDLGYKSPTQLMNTLWAVVK